MASPTVQAQAIPTYAELLAQQVASRLAFGRMLLNWRRRNSWSQYTAFTWAEAIGEPKLVISYGNLSVIEQGKAGELRQRAFWQLWELNRRIAGRDWGRFRDGALRQKLEAAIPLGDAECPVWGPLEFWACYGGLRPVPAAFAVSPGTSDRSAAGRPAQQPLAATAAQPDRVAPARSSHGTPSPAREWTQQSPQRSGSQQRPDGSTGQVLGWSSAAAAVGEGVGHRTGAHPPESLGQSSRRVKDRAMRPCGASLPRRCGRPVGVGFSAVPRWLPLFPALPSVPAMS